MIRIPNKKQIIVLTPVKNEEWVLERFLRITSEFADAIIVADQQSTDSTRDICSKFAKVCLINNPDLEYDEYSRQKLLIETARVKFPGPKILLALDADEILTADSIDNHGWDTMMTVPAGHALLFEKPEIIFRPEHCRQGGYFPLGYVDDGRTHHGQQFHSARVPAGPEVPKYFISGIRFLHLGMLREAEFFARQRLYSMMENISHTKSFYQRLIYYSGFFTRVKFNSQIIPTPKDWVSGWFTRGIDIFSYKTSDDSCFNCKVLELFAEHGESRFYWDDVWGYDWEALDRKSVV